MTEKLHCGAGAVRGAERDEASIALPAFRHGAHISPLPGLALTSAHALHNFTHPMSGSSPTIDPQLL